MQLSVTPMGWVLIPVTVAMALLRPRYLIAWAVYLSIFQAASVLNLGGDSQQIGVPPHCFVAAVILVYMLLDARRAAADSLRANAQFVIPLAALVVYAAVSATLLPIVFQGTRVYTDKVPVFIHDEPAFTPLAWSLSNLAQPVYLVLGAALMVAMLRHSLYSPRSVPRLLDVYYWAGITVVLFGLYQKAAWLNGLPYPDWFVNSNPGWIQNIYQRVGLARRVTATLVGPSEAGAFLAGWSTFTAVSIGEGNRRFADTIVLVLGLAVLVMTTAATGYAVALIMAGLLVLRWVAEIVGRKRFPKRWAFLGVLVVGAVILGAISLANLSTVVDQEVLEKLATSSGLQRLRLNLWGLHLFVRTFGLGVGLGSHRSYSLAANVVGGLGAVGTLLFGQLLWVTHTGAREATRAAKAGDRADVSALGWAFVANLLAMAFALPDMEWPFLWVLWGLLLAKCQMVSALADTSPASTASHAPPTAWQVEGPSLSLP